VPDLLTINGVTFDRGRIEIADDGKRRGVVARFRDRSGATVLALYGFRSRDAVAFREPCVCSVVAFDDPNRTGRLVAYLKPDGCSLHRPAQEWAPLLDLAVAAGLQLPGGA
jgi:hypothetical protein